MKNTHEVIRMRTVARGLSNEIEIAPIKVVDNVKKQPAINSVLLGSLAENVRKKVIRITSVVTSNDVVKLNFIEIVLVGIKSRFYCIRSNIQRWAVTH